MKQYLEENNIDVAALAQIRNRVFIVGRFNCLPTEGDPAIFLFTNRKVSDKFLGNFTDKKAHPISYSAFVDVLKPTLKEVYHSYKGGKLTLSEVGLPSSSEEGKGLSYVIDSYNYFFQRAISNSDQEVFASERPSLKQNGTDPLSGGGAQVLSQIRANLSLFCRFQHRHHEIVERFAHLLAKCARNQGLPPYVVGSPLPVGLAEKLIDFVYSEDTNKPFGQKDDNGKTIITGVQFDKKWTEEGKATLALVAQAFRDALTSESQQGAINIHSRDGGVGTLDSFANALFELDSGLRKEFRDARDAVNTLRQMLKSRVLLQMVLDWAFQGLFTQDILAQVAGEDDGRKCRRVAEIVATGLDGKIPKPVKRPTQEERERFSQSLAEHCATVIQLVVADSVDDAILRPLPPEIQDLVSQLRGPTNEDVRSTLRTITGHAGGGGTQNDPGRAKFEESFISTCRTIIKGVICPRLFRLPTLDRLDVQRMVSLDTIEAYLTALALSDKNEEAVRRLGDVNQKDFEKLLQDGNDGVRIGNSSAFSSKLLNDLLRLMAGKTLGNQLVEGVAALSQMDELFETLPSHETRLSDFVPIWPKEAKESPSVMASVPQTEAILESSVETALAAGSPAEPALGGSTGAGASPAVGSPAVEKPGATGQAVTVAEEVKRETVATRQSVLQRLRESGDPGPDDKKVHSEVARTVGENPKLQDRVGAALKASQQCMHTIYQRYSEKAHTNLEFKNKVERMTLGKILAAMDREIALGDPTSYLHKLLIDLVSELDEANPDRLAFLRKKSLTEYIDNPNLDAEGIEALLVELGFHQTRGMANIQNFVSELRGIKYLMDCFPKTGSPNPNAEIIVINATAASFSAWLQNENAQEQREFRRMEGNIVGQNQRAEGLIIPGLALMTQAAFDSNDQRLTWIKNLAGVTLRLGNTRFLLPPLCFSTGTRGRDRKEIEAAARGWVKEGQDVAAASADVPTPVVCLGPSPYLNKPAAAGGRETGFFTRLPVSYAFAARILGASVDDLQNELFVATSAGRFRVFDTNGKNPSRVLDEMIWPKSGDIADYAFAADYYLYVLLVLYATLKGKNTHAQLINYVHGDANSINSLNYKSSTALNEALPGNDALRFAILQPSFEFGNGPSVAMAKGNLDLLKSFVGKLNADKPAERAIWKSHDWFNAAYARL